MSEIVFINKMLITIIIHIGHISFSNIYRYIGDVEYGTQFDQFRIFLSSDSRGMRKRKY